MFLFMTNLGIISDADIKEKKNSFLFLTYSRKEKNKNKIFGNACHSRKFCSVAQLKKSIFVTVKETRMYANSEIVLGQSI